MSLRRDDEVFVVCAYSHPSHSETVKKSSLRVMGLERAFYSRGPAGIFFCAVDRFLDNRSCTDRVCVRSVS